MHAPTPIAKPRIVLADDQEELRTLLAMRLRRLDYDVLEVGDGLELVEAFDGPEGRDLIICDLQMPLLSGLDAMGRLRASNHSVPCILMTGFVSRETEARVAALGLAYIIEKPLDLQQLIGKAHSILGR